mmetsp:Transcript_22651/g.44752  ORF Transcript_22651/g.44752 Transcript_22651/m.44752 type:complete len:140 (+) Transcript_22651:228-647(+)
MQGVRLVFFACILCITTEVAGAFLQDGSCTVSRKLSKAKLPLVDKTKAICDTGAGGWLHFLDPPGGTPSLATPPSGCHEYVYLEGVPKAVTECQWPSGSSPTNYVQCSACASVSPSGKTVVKIGPECEDEGECLSVEQA